MSLIKQLGLPKSNQVYQVWDNPLIEPLNFRSIDGHSRNAYCGQVSSCMLDLLILPENKNKYFNMSGGRNINFMDSGRITELGSNTFNLRSKFGKMIDSKSYILISYTAPINNYYGVDKKYRNLKLNGYHLTYFGCHVKVNSVHDKYYLTEELYEIIKPILNEMPSSGYLDRIYYSFDSFILDVLRYGINIEPGDDESYEAIINKIEQKYFK